MFLETTLKRNPRLVEVVYQLHNEGLLQPDTYVIDYDQTLDNAKMILEKANEKNIKLYFMLKQLGRNPLLAKAFMDLGYEGAVVVDYREALVMMEHNIPLGNVGHLVQTPKHLIEPIVEYGTEVFTVFSFEKLVEINEAAKKFDKIQDVILKVFNEGDVHYRAQEGGINLVDIPNFVEKAKKLKHVKIVGATSFPAFLYSEKNQDIIKTQNYDTIYDAIDILRDLGCEIKQINVPSTTSVRTLDKMDGTHGEPGHGLTGTTPAHAHQELEEVPSIVYLSEISHNFKGKSYTYGGGYYRRSHLKKALVIENDTNREVIDVLPMDPSSIDYYFELSKNKKISSTVIMSFRFQIFVTRSRVAIVKGVKGDHPQLLGIFDSLGKEI